MDRGNKKRSRSSSSSSSLDPSKRGKKKIEVAPTPTIDPFVDEAADSHHRLLGVFEFPWQKESHLAAIDGDHGSDLRDVFFSSLVDGCKAAIGFPGDRLSPSPAPISLPDDTDGVDCIWSCVLREPLSLRCVQ